MSARVLPIESFEPYDGPGQNPEFVRVQEHEFKKDPGRYRFVEEVALRIARENGAVVRIEESDARAGDPNRRGPGGIRYSGGVSMNDVQDEIDPRRTRYRSHEWGCFAGTLSGSKFLVVVGRVRSTTPGRNSAYINLYQLAPGAIRDAPVPVLPPTEVSA